MAIIVDLNKTIVRDDQPIEKTISYLNSLSEPVYIVSGSHVSKKYEIQRMLSDFGVKYTSLILNPNDYGDDNEFKYSVGMSLKSLVRLAVDNSSKARMKYESLGIKTIHPDDLPDMKSFWSI
jgi:predicted HAD superfamily phosphohydrolase YqeG